MREIVSLPRALFTFIFEWTIRRERRGGEGERERKVAPEPACITKPNRAFAFRGIFPRIRTHGFLWQSTCFLPWQRHAPTFPGAKNSRDFYPLSWIFELSSKFNKGGNGEELIIEVITFITIETFRWNDTLMRIVFYFNRGICSRHQDLKKKM